MEKARGSEYAKWTTFRSDDASLWLCLAANRFVLRPDWANSLQPVTSFSWASEAGKPGQPLWGSPVWAMGVAMAAAFADGGIRFPCVGREAPGRLENLPLVPYPVARGDAFALPVEVKLDERKAFELKQCGFAPLTAQADSDSAFFTSVSTFHQPARYDTKEATRASFLAATLPYQAFAGVAARTVQRLGHSVSAGLGEAEITARFMAAMKALLATCEDQVADDEVAIVITPAEQAPEQLEVAIRLRPAFTIYGGEVDLVVGTTLR